MIRSDWLLGVAILLALAAAPGRGFASEPEEREKADRTHHLSLFLGAASRSEEPEAEHGFAAGLIYEYKLDRWLGVGGLIEVASGGLRDVVVGVPITLHPLRDLSVVFAPAAEFSDRGTEFLLRLGVGWEFPFCGRFSVAPEFNIDFVDGEQTYVYGLSFGVGF